MIMEKNNETKRKYRIWIKQTKTAAFENIKKNTAVFMGTIYIILFVFWTTIGMLISGDITEGLFWTLIINGINAPVVIMMSIVLTGKWKLSERIAEIDRAVALKDIEIALKKQRIEFLQEKYDSKKEIEELKKELIFDRYLSEHKLLTLALKYNKTITDANEGIREIEQIIDDAVEHKTIGIELPAEDQEVDENK